MIAAGITPTPIVNLQARSTMSFNSLLPIGSNARLESRMAPRLVAKASRQLTNCIEETAASIVPPDLVDAHSAVMIADSRHLKGIFSMYP